MPNITLFSPDQLLRPGQAGWPDFGPFKYKFIAQGDSWFSIGAIPPTATTNILLELNLQAKSCAVNCAHPGFTLARMVDFVKDPTFTQLVVGNQAWKWDGFLMSAGGNDLIDAVQVLPRYGDNHPLQGQLIEPRFRILLRPDEWGPGPGASRYVSDEGWQTFSTMLQGSFQRLANTRDHVLSKSQGVPVFVHCYDYLLARNAPAGAGAGPWLYPAVTAYQIPAGDWGALGQELITRLKELVESCQQILSNLTVIDTTDTLIAADPGTTGPSNDWQNEIHPTQSGYRKIAAKYAAEVDNQFP